MQIDTDGLKECHHLFLRIALGTHRGLPHGSRTKVGDGLQIFHQQRTRHHRGHIIIIGYLRPATGEQLIGGSLGNIEKRIDLVLMNGATSLSHRWIMSHDA